MSQLDEKPDTSWTDDPVCPYCGNEEKDAWEMDFGPGFDGNTKHMCAACGKEYFVSRFCIIKYESSKPIS